MRIMCVIAAFVSLIPTESSAVEVELFLSWAASFQAQQNGLAPSPDREVQAVRNIFAERFVRYVSGVADAMSSPAARRSGSAPNFAACVPKTVSDVQLANQVMREIGKDIPTLRQVGPSLTVSAIVSGLYPYPCRK